MNATRLGIRAHRVLLDGERLEDYELEAARWIQGLDPQTDAEVEVVLDVVDVRIRLGRLENAVKAKTAASVTKTVTETLEHQRLALTQNALTLLAAMKMTIDHAVSTKTARFESLLAPVRNVLAVVTEIQGQHATLIKGLVQIEEAVEDLVIFTGSECPAGMFAAISGFIDEVTADLQGRAIADQVAVEEVRIEAAMCAVPNGEPEFKRLHGYRRHLERQLQADLELLEQLRRLRPGGGSGSFVRPIQVNLRPVVGAQALAHG
jgi:hypothetical protein